MFDLLLMIHFYVKCIENLSPKLTQPALSHPCIYVIFFCLKKNKYSLSIQIFAFLSL